MARIEIDTVGNVLDIIVQNGNRVAGIFLSYSSEDDRDSINELLDAINAIKQAHWDVIIEETLSSYINAKEDYYLVQMGDVKRFIKDNLF